MRVLILGSGAKDHAIAWWFYQSNCLEELFIAPGNVATGRFATNLNIDPSDPVEVYEMCIEHSINYVFIGTEAPLFTGVVDYLNERGIHTFGAPKRALKLEADRNFARAFTDRHNIPTPRRNLFTTMDALEKWAADEFRSINGQLQWIITEALRKNGRLKKSRPTPSEPPKE